MQKDDRFDVVICGAGLAGLTLARQLQLELPALSVAIVDRQQGIIPEAAHKVGESTIESASYYLGQVLQLQSYFEENHYHKLGLRFFVGGAQGRFSDRPELGPALYPPVPSYQIDRGRLENDLRDLVKRMGVSFYEGALVDDIQISITEAPHEIRCRRIADGTCFSLRGRWLVDASGRRRLLQSELKLKLESPHKCSAAWWRIDSRVDVDDLGEADNPRWQQRNVEKRYFSTNHLMGRGYWVWLIPLASGATSVGIVADDSIHPFNTYGNSYERACLWLQEHEPALWSLLQGQQPLDFKARKQYSYLSPQLYSHQRWACVGDAGFFLDPLYSLGADFIAVGNSITVELIRRDLEEKLTEETVADFNELILGELIPLFMPFYQDTYKTFAHPHIFVAKFTWDTALYWATLATLFFQDLIRQPSPAICQHLRSLRLLNERVQRLFIDWAEVAPPRGLHVALGDVTRMPLMQLLHLDLTTKRSPAQWLVVLQQNTDCFEEMAQNLFWQAVKECLPHRHPLSHTPMPWLNAWQIALDASRWPNNGLFQPSSHLRSLRAMKRNFAGLFAPMSLPEKLIIEFPYKLLQWRQGFVNYRVVRQLHHWIISGKPALWARNLFVRGGSTVSRQQSV